MDEKHLQKKLGEAILKNWVTFFYSLMIPNAIIPILAGIITISLSFFVLSSLLSKLTYLAGSLLFSFGSSGIKNNYDKLTSGAALLQKSKSATRNLQSIINHCKRISTATNKLSSRKRIAKNSFKELGRNVENIASRVNSGIEDWKDIVPELKIARKGRRKRRPLYNGFSDNHAHVASFCGYYPEHNTNKLCLNCPARKVMES